MTTRAEVQPLPGRVGDILTELMERSVMERHPSGAPFLTTYQDWITLPTVDGDGDDLGEQDFRITIECLGNRPIREYSEGPQISGGTNHYTEPATADDTAEPA